MITGPEEICKIMSSVREAIIGWSKIKVRPKYDWTINVTSCLHNKHEADQQKQRLKIHGARMKVCCLIVNNSPVQLIFVKAMVVMGFCHEAANALCQYLQLSDPQPLDMPFPRYLSRSW